MDANNPFQANFWGISAKILNKLRYKLTTSR